jgi:hypothetical protein
MFPCAVRRDDRCTAIVAGTQSISQENTMKTLRKILAGVVPGAMLAFGSALALDGEVPEKPSLAGTWEYVMTVRLDAADCTTSEPITFGPNPFPALVSFHEGGTMNEYASRTPPTIRTTAFGSWKQVGKYSYKARHTFMEFDANGLLWRNMVIESKIHLGKHGNKYKGEARLQLTDVSGNVLRFCATTEGVRFTP